MVLSVLLVTKKVKPLNRCVLLCLKWVDTKNTLKPVASFVIKDDDVLDKYNEIWDKIKMDLNIKLHSMPVQKNT